MFGIALSGGLAVAGAVAVAFALGVVGNAAGTEGLAVLVAGLLAMGVGLLSITRFDLFVVFLLVIRASLDALGQGGLEGGAIDPAGAIGAVFIAAGSLWLFLQYRTGDWVRPAAPTWALYALCAASAASVFTSASVGASIQGTSRLVAGVLMFAVLEQLLGREDQSANRFIGALFASAVLPMLVAYQQFVAGTDTFSSAEEGRVFGTFGHPNVFASYLVTVMLVAVVVALRGSGRLRVAAFTILVTATPLLVFTYTRGSWISLIIGLLYLGWRLDRRILIGLVVGICVVMVSSPTTVARITDVTDPEEVSYDGPTNSFEWRLDYWGELIPLASESPVTGIGIEMTARVSDQNLPPHNAFVQAYVETGILGLAAVLAVIATFTVHLRRRLRDAVDETDRIYAIMAIAVALAAVVEAPGMNLLTRTVGYWYVALAMLYGYGHGGKTASGTGHDATSAGKIGSRRAGLTGPAQ